MLIERPQYVEKLIALKDRDLIKVITGVRRCGKSVLLFKLYYDWLLQHGVPDRHIIKINLEDLPARPLRQAESLYRHITERATESGKYYVFIDEIQYVDQFEDLLNSLNNAGLDVYITGSNSHLLSGEISTALRGRSLEIRVHPLSFAEYFAFSGGEVNAAWKNYALYGGFPYAAQEDNPAGKTAYLSMLEQTVATRDVIERHGVRNVHIFNALYDFLCSNIGSLVSAKKIADSLRSAGYGAVSADTIGNYLQYLCDAFLFYKVCRRDVKGKEYFRGLNKYYASDIGLRNVRLNFRQVEITHTLENIIYLELLRRGFMVDIGKNRDKEIDFIATDSYDTYYLQVAYHLPTPEKVEQEISSFYRLDDGYKKILITMDDDPFTQLKRGYKKINALEFLLDRNCLRTI